MSDCQQICIGPAPICSRQMPCRKQYIIYGSDRGLCPVRAASGPEQKRNPQHEWSIINDTASVDKTSGIHNMYDYLFLARHLVAQSIRAGCFYFILFYLFLLTLYVCMYNHLQRFSPEPVMAVYIHVWMYVWTRNCSLPASAFDLDLAVAQLCWRDAPVPPFHGAAARQSTSAVMFAIRPVWFQTKAFFSLPTLVPPRWPTRPTGRRYQRRVANTYYY